MCHFIDYVDITGTVFNFLQITKLIYTYIHTHIYIYIYILIYILFIYIYVYIYTTFSGFKDLKIVGDSLCP